jgi:hypothetical protein
VIAGKKPFPQSIDRWPPLAGFLVIFGRIGPENSPI